jgi:mRNA-degrading endonuclease RelE of RelBE toxin-antitoxin system
MAEIRWHPRVWDVLERLSESQARRITQTVKLLRTFPQIGVPVQDPVMSGARRLMAGGWAIVYTYDAGRDLETVLLLRPPRVGWGGDLVD